MWRTQIPTPVRVVEARGWSIVRYSIAVEEGDSSMVEQYHPTKWMTEEEKQDEQNLEQLLHNISVTIPTVYRMYARKSGEIQDG